MAPVLTFDIDRSSPTPLYFQLAQAIEGAISGGTLPAGSRLENEVLLAQGLLHEGERWPSLSEQIARYRAKLPASK